MIPSNSIPACHFRGESFVVGSPTAQRVDTKVSLEIDPQQILKKLKSSLLSFLSETKIDDNYILCGSTALGVYLNELLQSPEHQEKFTTLLSEKNKIKSINIENQTDFDLVTNSQTPNINALIEAIENSCGDNYNFITLNSEEYMERQGRNYQMEDNEVVLVKSDSVDFQSCYRGEEVNSRQIEKGLNLITGRSRTLTIMHLGKVVFKIDVIYQPADIKVFNKYPSLFNIFGQNFAQKEVDYQGSTYQVNIFPLSELVDMLNIAFINAFPSCHTHNNKFLDRLVLLNELNNAGVLKDGRGYLDDAFSQHAEFYNYLSLNLSKVEQVFYKKNEVRLTQQLKESIVKNKADEIMIPFRKKITKEVKDNFKKKLALTRTQKGKTKSEVSVAVQTDKDQLVSEELDCLKAITISTATQTEWSSDEEATALTKEWSSEKKPQGKHWRPCSQKNIDNSVSLKRVVGYLNKSSKLLDKEDVSGAIPFLIKAFDKYHSLREKALIFSGPDHCQDLGEIESLLDQMCNKLNNVTDEKDSSSHEPLVCLLVIINFYYFACVAVIQKNGGSLCKPRLNFIDNLDFLFSNASLRNLHRKFEEAGDKNKLAFLKYLESTLQTVLDIFDGSGKTANEVRSKNPTVVIRILKYISFIGKKGVPDAVFKQLDLYRSDYKYYKANISQCGNYHLKVINDGLNSIKEPENYFSKLSSLYKWFYHNSHYELSALILAKHLALICNPENIKYSRLALDNDFLEEKNLETIVKIYKNLPIITWEKAYEEVAEDSFLRLSLNEGLYKSTKDVRDYLKTRDINLDILQINSPEEKKRLLEQPWFTASYPAWCSIL